MKALSIRQPWAWLIVNGYKTVENRPRSTEYRGQILLHASKTLDKDGYEYCSSILNIPTVDMFSRMSGGFVGLANIVDCVTSSQSPWFTGPVGWVMSDPQSIDFIPYRGQLGLFTVPDDILEGTKT